MSAIANVSHPCPSPAAASMEPPQPQPMVSALPVRAETRPMGVPLPETPTPRAPHEIYEERARPSLLRRLGGGLVGCFRGPYLGAVGMPIEIMQNVSGTSFPNGDPIPGKKQRHMTSAMACPIVVGAALLGCLVGPCWCCFVGCKEPDSVGA